MTGPDRSLASSTTAATGTSNTRLSILTSLDQFENTFRSVRKSPPGRTGRRRRPPEEFGHRKREQAVAHAIDGKYLSRLGVYRHACRPHKPGRRSFDNSLRRHVAVICRIPDAD